MLEQRAKSLVSKAYQRQKRSLAERFEDPALSAGDRVLAGQLLETPSVRTSSMAVLRLPHTRRSRQEEFGVLSFLSLVTNADILMDENKIPQGSPEDVRSSLLAQRVRRADVTLGELERRTLGSFTPEKQQPIVDFLDRCVRLHSDIGSKSEPGSYGFDEVLDYRWQTVAPYADTTVTLASIRERLRAPLVLGAVALQFLDDGIDIREDTGEQSMNLFVGMARDLGELEMLQDAAAEPTIPDRALPQYAPHAYEAYRGAYTNVVTQVDNVLERVLLNKVGGIIFKQPKVQTVAL